MRRHFLFALSFFCMVMLLSVTDINGINTDNGIITASSSPNSPEMQPLNLLGQLGGTTGAVTISGNFAYVGIGPRLVILNVSNPAAPTFAGQSEIFTGQVSDIEVRNSFAYVAGGDGLRVIDITNPSIPTVIGYFATTGSVQAVALKDQYAFIAFKGIRVINIANPSNPVQSGNVAGVTASDLAISGQFLHVASGSTGLEIFNISNPTTPNHVSSLDTPGYATRITTVGSYAYVADGQGGIRIINISNPNQPVEAGHYQVNGRFFYDVAVVGNKAYIVGGLYYGLRIIDISDPANPFELGYQISYGGMTSRVAVSGNYAYVAQDRELTVISVLTPSSPQIVWNYDVPMSIYDVDAQGAYVFVAANSEGLTSVDVTNPSSPQTLSRINNGWFASSVFVQGNLAYVSLDPDLYIVNISNPSNLTLMGSYTPGSNLYVDNVFVQNDYAYVTLSSGQGLKILNVSNPTLPTEVGSFVSPDNPYTTAVAVTGNYAYLAESTGYLRILNVSNAANPVQVGTFNTQLSSLKKMALHGAYLYLANYNQSVQIINVSNPTSPTLVATLYDAVSDVGIRGNHLFVVTNTGLRIIDVTTPTQLGDVEFFAVRGASDLDISDNKVYLTGYGVGLQVLELALVSDAVIPTSGGNLLSSGDQTSYQFPSGTFSSSVTVTHTIRSEQSVVQPSGFSSIGHVFDVSAVYSNGQPAQPIPGHSYSITITYTELELNGVDESTLALYFWNGSQWVAEVTSQVNPVTNQISATPDHLSTWAIWGETPDRILIPIIVQD